MKKISEIKVIIPAEEVGYAIGSVSPPMVSQHHFVATERSRDLLQRASSCYDALEHLRRRRIRSRKYYRGDQWSDMVEVNGCKMTEEEYIESQGKPALKQNLIRPPVRNIIGQYRSQPFKSVIYSRNKDDKRAAEMVSVALESAYEMNDGRERDARLLEEFLISGAPIYETSFSYDITRQRPIPKFRAVNISRFFISTDTNDVCGDDVDLVGEIVDIPLDSVVSSYATNEAEEAELRNIYSNSRRTYNDMEALTSKNVDDLSFYVTNSVSTCRVIKVCVLEGKWVLDVHDYLDGSRKICSYSKLPEIEMENAERIATQEVKGINIPLITYKKKYVRQWVYYHLTPQGHILFRKVNPYHHKGHPYVFKLYPLVDGDVWSLVEDLIDQQRMINRMIILQDFVISASAKGVLLVPEDAIPDDMDIEDFAEEWTRYNGVIKIKTRGGVELPKQVVASNFNLGLNDMINLQISLIQDIGGVHNAMMGKQAQSGTSAARYKQETANASLNAVDYLESFGWLLIKRDWKIVQIIKQFYTDKQYIELAGSDYSEEAKHYDPDIIKDIDFDNTMAKGDDNFTMRFVSEDSLMKLLEMKLIGLKQYLKASESMYSEKLLSMVEEQEAALANGQLNQEQLMAMLSQAQTETPPSTPQGLNNARGFVNNTVV